MIGTLLSLLLLATGGPAAGAAAGPPLPPYPLALRSFEVHYRVTGTRRGTETLAVVDSGAVLPVHIHDTLRDGSVVDSLRVVTPTGGYQIVNGDTLPLSIGWAFVERFLHFKLWNSLATGEPPAEGALFEKIGQEKILGHPCTTYNTFYLRRNTQISGYQGIPLLFVWVDSTDTGPVVNEKRAVYLKLRPTTLQDPALQAARALLRKSSKP